MKIPSSFWEAEERDGFFVTTERKAVWAVQLRLLVRLDAVCRRHGLT